MKIVYDSEVDALRISFQETTVTTKELAEGITADYDRDGQLAGLEILNATKQVGGAENLQQIALSGVGKTATVRRSEDGHTYSAEAVTWLTQGTLEYRSVGDSSDRLTHDDSVSVVRELYAAGAVLVHVVGRYLDDEEEGADWFEVFLPGDSEQRRTLFEIQSRIMKETGSPFDPDKEQGQPSLTIGW